MRTTLEIRDDLMRSLLARPPGVPAGRAVEHAIEAYLAQDPAARAQALTGRVRVEDVSGMLRRGDRGS